jgi:ferric-dicitrate binding protein FerR (iron transport regulator)
VHGPGAAQLARSLRARGLRAVATGGVPTPSWLRGVGLDAAVVVNGGGQREVVLADDSRRELQTAISSLLEE